MTLPYVSSLVGGLMALLLTVMRPIIQWFQEKFFLMSIFIRIFYYNGEDFNKITPSERRMLSRVMKLKAKLEPQSLQSFTMDGSHADGTIPDIDHLESITDVSSVQAGSILNKY